MTRWQCAALGYLAGCLVACTAFLGMVLLDARQTKPAARPAVRSLR